MEEKKIRLNQEDLTYLIRKIRCDILPKHTTYDEITEKITKLFTPVIDTELSNLENTGKNLKPFDLEAARSGKPVCTRDGRKARIICFNAKRDAPIIALVTTNYGKEIAFDYSLDGLSANSENEDNDLMMLREKHEGWVNIIKEPLDNDTVALGRIYDNYENAVKLGKSNDKYVATVKIEWEE